MSNDFRSLLSTFQAASSGTTPIPTNDTTILEATTQLWRLTQLKKSLNKTNQHQSTSLPSPPLHLAVCLCVVDEFPHEEIWKHWMGDSNQVSLYIHAKHPEKITSKWLQDKLIRISHKPNWNDVRIIKAMLSLAKEAFKDKRVTHVYFGTESCIPITSLQDALQHLQHDTSYCRYYDKSRASRFEERNCWSVLEEYIPSNAICKALPGWCVLCRTHLQAILDIPVVELWTAFQHVWAPEEVYFATCLSLLGLLDQTQPKSLVHVEWKERARNHEDRAHPKEYDDAFHARFVHHVTKDEGCIFLRKLKRHMPLHKWKCIVLGEYEAGEKRPRHDDYTSSSRSRDDRRTRRREHHYHDRLHHDGRRPRHDDHQDRYNHRSDHPRNDDKQPRHGHYKR